MRLVVTRPEPDAGRTALALEALGHAAILSPALRIEADGTVRLPKRRYQAVLVTSANAVRALAAHPERDLVLPLPLYAVGDSTALEARRAGFAGSRSAGGDVAALAALVRGELDPAAGPLFYAAGEAQADDLAGRLGGDGFAVDIRILYRAVAEPRLAPAAAAAFGQGAVDGVLVYSRRSAAAFALALRAERLAPLPPEVACYCLSAAAAEPLRPIAAGPIRIAAEPDQARLFALLEGV